MYMVVEGNSVSYTPKKVPIGFASIRILWALIGIAVLVMVTVLPSSAASQSTDDLIAQADSLYQSGNYQEAIAIYNSVLELEPDNVYVLYAKGNCLYQLKEYNAAVEYYSQALNLDPTNYVLLNNMGNAYYALKDFDKAVEYYSQALNLSPPDAIDSVASNLLDAQYAAGDYDGAEKTLTIIKELRIPAILSEADELFNRGDYTEAADKYSSALELNSSQATVWYALAFCQYLLGDYEDAVTSANRALLLLSPLSAKGAVISTQGDMVVGKPVSIKISSPGDVALTIEPSDGIWVNGISYFAPVVLDGNDECEVVFSTSGDYLLSVGAGHERAFSSIHITGEDERKSTYGHINDYLMVFVVGIILGVFVGYAVRFGKRLGKEE